MRRGTKPAKAKVKAKPSIARKSRKSENSRVHDLEKRLAEALEREAEAQKREVEALEQQTATSEILKVIARSPTDTQPVFDAIVENAARLCSVADGYIILVEDEVLRAVSVIGQLVEQAPVYNTRRVPLSRESVAGRAIVDRATIHITDLASLSEAEFPEVGALQRLFGHHTMLATPLLREGTAIGVIVLFRFEVRPFSERQIELLKTFADQAVIAVENVRLFKELEVRNHDLTESLDQQTATSEILRVISSSPTDNQPVFDTIAANAARLCAARDAQVLRVDGDVLRLVSAYGSPSMAPMRSISRGHAVGRAVIDRQTVHVRDMAQAVMEFPESSAPQHGVESLLAVPLLRNDVAVGVIRISRTQIQPFTDAQIELLKTFADQAVIAIENVRLFKELEARNRDLTESLEQQTATAEVLRVISSSPTDLQPVLATVAENAARVCGANDAQIFRVEGDVLCWAASYGPIAPYMENRPINRGWVSGRAVVDRRTIHVPDLAAESDTEYPVAKADQRVTGHRTTLATPLLREGTPIGVIVIRRVEVLPFSERQVRLLETFADQAVIAIENVRLFTELEARTADLTRSVEQLTALGEVGRAVSSTLDLETVLTTIVSRAVQLSGLDGGVVFEYDEGTEEFVQRAATDPGGALADARRTTRIRKGEGVLGRTAITLEPIQVPDITVPAAYEGRLREILVESGIRAILAVPMVREGRLIGCLAVTRNQPGDFPAETIELLRTFATQSALAIQNARLFHEIEDKSRQLEAASRHKSEFLANMSHELRTPLNAVIGFSEVLLQRMFGALNDKQDEYLKDIYASGQHLLSLINDILDLSKIEAGRMELAPAPFHLPTALENAVTLVKERAARHGVTLELDLDPGLGELVGDERKVKQVLLNLLSNAVKFTPEGGRIRLKAGRRDGAVAISVTDTGIGIAPEDQAAIFEEFRQVGSDETRKQEGTGLGLTLAKKFVELHDGRMWIESELGRGSTFTFTLPAS